MSWTEVFPGLTDEMVDHYLKVKSLNDSDLFGPIDLAAMAAQSEVARIRRKRMCGMGCGVEGLRGFVRGVLGEVEITPSAVLSKPRYL